MRILILAAAFLACASAQAEKTDLEQTGRQGDYYFYSVSKPWSHDSAYLEKVIKGVCAAKTFCFVHIWDKSAGGARRMPLTDKQLSSMLVMYRQNKNTALSELLFNCKRFPKTPKAQCL